MATIDDREQRRAGPCGESLVSAGTCPGAGVVVLDTVIDADFLRRFKRALRHPTLSGKSVGWRVALMANVTRGSIATRTTWRTGSDLRNLGEDRS